MNSGSYAAFQAAAELGDPPEECAAHNWYPESECPYCEIEDLKDRLSEEAQWAYDLEDAWYRMAVIADALAAELEAISPPKKICPLCGGADVIVFTSDLDKCRDCKKYFPGS